jgi:crossover junction endodeoxyribonuclease RuvC
VIAQEASSFRASEIQEEIVARPSSVVRSGSSSRIEHVFVLGIDPGLTRCGFGLIEGSLEGPEKFRAVEAGVLESPSSMPVEERLAALTVDLRTLLNEMTLDAVVVERLFFQRNANTAIGVAQASGLAIGLAGERGLPVRQFTSQEVKLAVTGYGAADKAQVQAMVARHCRLEEPPTPPDAADALALAIAYLLTTRTEARLTAGVR